MEERAPVSEITQSFIAGQISRREFIGRMTALGLTMTSIGAILAACGSPSTPAATGAAGPSVGAASPSGGAATGPWAADPKSLSATVKMYKGPFSADEAKFQKQFYIDPFNAKFPNIKVDFSSYDWTQGLAQMTASLSGGQHDVLYIPEVFFGTFPFKDGLVEDLEPWEQDPELTDITKNFIQGYLTRSKPSSPDGLLGGLPWIDNAQAMIFINLDLFQRAGVDVATWNESYDSMTEAARKIRALGGDIYGIMMRENGAKNFGWFEWYGYMMRAGTDFLNADFSAPAINTPEFAAALQMIQDWHVKDKVMPEFGKYPWEGTRAQFNAGNVGILLDEPQFTGVISTAKPAVTFKWDVAKYPPGPKKDVMLANAGLWVMSNQSQNKQATWEVMKFWTIPNQEYDKATGVMPIITDWKEKGFWASDPLTQKLEGFLPFTQGPIVHPKVQQMKSICEPLFDDVYAGKKTPQDALAAASDQIAAALKS